MKTCIFSLTITIYSSSNYNFRWKLQFANEKRSFSMKKCNLCLKYACFIDGVLVNRIFHRNQIYSNPIYSNPITPPGLLFRSTGCCFEVQASCRIWVASPMTLLSSVIALVSQIHHATFSWSLWHGSGSFNVYFRSPRKK